MLSLLQIRPGESRNYTEIGIGYIYEAGSPYGGYFTAVFARP